MTTSGKPEDTGETDSASLACPTCGEPAAPPAEKGERSPRPFCSRRCADIDLGSWFQERYAIPAVEDADDSIVESLAGAGGPPEQE
jgi:endogenous inhibitor of DNA gyrase (YacG/DUF329 family)